MSFSVSADELNRKGAALFVQGDVVGARLHYLASLSADAGFLPALANIAALEAGNNNLTVAASYVRSVLARAPHDGVQLNNLGNILTRASKFEEAEVALKRAAEIMPEAPGVWHNLGLLYYRWRKYAEAAEAIAKTQKLGSRGPQVQNDLAHILLAQGKFREGLDAYESRWHTLTHLPPWDFHIPEWKGEDLRGKSILFHAEQGYGDSIMAARFACDLAARGAATTLCVPRILGPMFEVQEWPGVTILEMEELETDDFDPRAFDFQSPMYSALRWMDIEPDSISPEPYIKVPATHRIVGKAFNVGICWASGKRFTDHDRGRRVSPLELWLPLAELPGVRLWSLQKGPDENEIEEIGAEALVRNESHRLTDFLETALLISQLDLVIAVDTAVVHLAGAMGKPTIMLSQYSNCWRWWDIENGTGKPWYSDVQILRQPEPGDWASLLKSVRGLVWDRTQTKLEVAA